MGNRLAAWAFRRVILPRVFWFYADGRAGRIDLETGDTLIHRDDVKVEWL